MRFTTARKTSPIGIDIGSHSFKAVQLKSTADKWDIANAVILPRVDPAIAVKGTEIARLVGVLDRRGFSGRDVVVAVPGASLLTTILELPARAPGVPIEQIAAIEFARVHKQEAAALTMSTWELPAPARAGKATYMMAVGAATNQLELHTDAIESSGLNVVAIEEPYSAATRGAMHYTGGLPGLVAVIDLGWESGRLTLVRANQVIYTRKLNDAGLNKLYQKVHESSATSEVVQQKIWQTGFVSSTQNGGEHSELVDALEEHFSAVAREISQAFSYAQHRYSDASISKAILIGGGAVVPGLSLFFETELGVSVSIPTTSLSTDTPLLTTAVGLALSAEAMR